MNETVENKQNQKRLISLADEFMKDKKILDIQWVYLQLNSYIGKDIQGNHHRFVYKTFPMFNDLQFYNTVIELPLKYTDNEEKICCYNTFVNSFKLLKKINYVQEGKIVDNHKKEVDVYYLKEDFTPFKLIPYKTLQELQELYCKNIIKVYTYLLNCFDFKKNKNEKYKFTLEELATAVGYTSRGYNEELKKILEILKNNDFIQYHKEKIKINNKNTYYHFLDNVVLEKPIITSNEQYEGGFIF